MIKAKIMILGTVIVLSVLAVSSDAKKIEVMLQTSNLTTYAAGVEQLGDFYVLEVDVPTWLEGKEIYSASLEFYVDAAVMDTAAMQNDSPRIQVFALKSDLGETLDLSKIDRTGPAVINIPRGNDERVWVDVTDIIRAYVKNPSSNHGLVIGSLTGARDGIFTIKSGHHGPGSIAKLKIHYNKRS
jgi:hypothetical protein